MDIGDLCTHCGRDTSMGSGNFVNRISSGTTIDTAQDWMDKETYAKLNPQALLTGYLCPTCQAYDCDKCGKPIFDDGDVTDKTRWGHYHPECLPKEQHAGWTWDDEPCACHVCEA